MAKSGIPCLTLILVISILASAVEGFECSKKKVDLINNTNVNIEIMEGEQFEVELKSNPSTGFDWYLVSEYNAWSSLDNEKAHVGAENMKRSSAPIEVVRTAYEKSSGSEKKLGVPGVTKFCIRAVRDTATTVKFAYARYWEMSKDGDGDHEIRTVRLTSDRDLQYYELLYDFA